jgi:thiamine-monophosphate kinase
MISENRIVRLLRDRYQNKSIYIKKGIGDDAAVIQPGNAREYWVLTTDMLLENIDFRRQWTTPFQLGYRSLAVNLSDLAAMGARPQFFTVCLALPSELSEHWISQFYRGLTELGDAQGALLIGGDLSSTEGGIQISIMALGESVRRKVLYRSGGGAGNALYVTGVLGQSASGLKLLQDGCMRPRTRAQKEAIRSHREPEPRCDVGMWLAQSGMVSCMMDLSDGLSADLPRMCAASGVSAEIDTVCLPIFQASSLWGCDPIALALHGGEDFELLFAIPNSKVRLLEKTYPAKFPQLTRIGKMIPGNGTVWITEGGKNRHRLMEYGYDHFRHKQDLRTQSSDPGK